MKNEIASRKTLPKKRVSIIKTVILKQGSIMSEDRELNDPYKAASFARKLYEGVDRECVWVCTLDSKCHPLSIELVSMGTINQALISPREIFKSAILSCSAHIMLFHNHISGNPTPSKQDITATKRIKESGDLLGISLLDHIILGENDKYISLREEEIISNLDNISYVTE